MQAWTELLLNLKWKHYAIALLTALVLVGPGFLIIAKYHPDYLVGLDVFKLMILAGALTLPIAIMNAGLLTVTQFDDRPQDAGENMDSVWMISAFGTIAVFYSALWIAYSYSLSFKQMVYAGTCLEVGFIGFILFLQWDSKRVRARLRDDDRDG